MTDKQNLMLLNIATFIENLSYSNDIDSPSIYTSIEEYCEEYEDLDITQLKEGLNSILEFIKSNV